jgi:hypothetical protein
MDGRKQKRFISAVHNLSLLNEFYIDKALVNNKKQIIENINNFTFINEIMDYDREKILAVICL